MIGENIRKFRKIKIMSQEQLAEALGISRQSVSKWETGAALPDTDNLIKVASVLGVSVEDLSQERLIHTLAIPRAK